MTGLLNLRKFLLFLGDILILYLSLLLAVFFGFLPNFHWQLFISHLIPFTILYPLWIIIFYIFELYDLHLFKEPLTLYTRIFTSLLFCLAIGITFFYLFPCFGISPKTNLFLDILFLAVLAILWRNLFFSLFSSYFQSKIAILGKNPQAENLFRAIKENPHLGYRFIGFLNPKEDIYQQILAKQPDTLIIAENIETNSPLTKSLYQCIPLKLNFVDLAQAYEIIFEKIPIYFINQIWFLKNIKEREKGFYNRIKRIIDIKLALIILIITAPLWLIIAVLIKMEDRGPVFYCQKRIGKDNIPFFLIKFRSMKTEAERETGPVWAKKEDPRITKTGKILRQLHLDEIPQMINVLRGEISLVGPRPERPEFVSQLEKEIPYYQLRHLIKPGFTGWAQIKFRYGRSVMDSSEKFQYDLYYLKNRSLVLDFKILLKTFQLFFRKE